MNVDSETLACWQREIREWADGCRPIEPRKKQVAAVLDALFDRIAALEAENAALGGRLDMANEDWASDDTEIRDLCRPIIGEREADGDSLGVTPLAEVVEKSIAALEAENAALREVVIKTALVVHSHTLLLDRPSVEYVEAIARDVAKEYGVTL